MIRYFSDIDQGSDEWHAAKAGVLSASQMHIIVTPTRKTPAANARARLHFYRLMGERIRRLDPTREDRLYVEPQYVSDDMLRGMEDEIEAKRLYAEHYAPIQNMGFITNDEWGFTLGYSPDGLVGDDGCVECKSVAEPHYLRIFTESLAKSEVPPQFVAQIQTGLLVSGRKWCDLLCYSGGWPMITTRVLPDQAAQATILKAASEFEANLRNHMEAYAHAMTAGLCLVPTKRRMEVGVLLKTDMAAEDCL